MNAIKPLWLNLFRSYIKLKSKLGKTVFAKCEKKNIFKMKRSIFSSSLKSSPLADFNLISNVWKENFKIFHMSAI